MNVAPTFAVGIGNTSVEEHLPILRQLFVEHRKDIKPSSQQGKELFSTTLTGYFTDSGATNHLNQHKELFLLRKSIEAAAQSYASTCGYAMAEYVPEVANFWLTEMVAGQTHPKHIHYGYSFSGCIYIDMPENAPGISFLSFRDRYDTHPLNIERYTMFNSGIFDLRPAEGQLLIWESWLAHQVNPGQFDGVRRVAGFDIAMKHIPQQG
jgi:uncharacterized protein (TIGR02466 family)